MINCLIGTHVLMTITVKPNNLAVILTQLYALEW